MPYYDTRVDLAEVMSELVIDRVDNGEDEWVSVEIDLRGRDYIRLDAGEFWERYEHPALRRLADDIAGTPVFQAINFQSEESTPGRKVDIYPGRIPVKRIIKYDALMNSVKVQYIVCLRHQPPVRMRGENDAPPAA